ncbi:MAG: hypothetical protein QM756_43410 [Polyangiaceae bacterium]
MVVFEAKVYGKLIALFIFNDISGKALYNKKDSVPGFAFFDQVFASLVLGGMEHGKKGSPLCIAPVDDGRNHCVQLFKAHHKQ